MKRWILTCFAMLSLLALIAGTIASPAAAAPGSNATNAKACQKGKWETLARSDSPTVAFVSQEACVSYAAQGGTITTRTTPRTARVVITVTGPSDGRSCPTSISLVDVDPGTMVYLTITYNNYTGWQGPIEAGSVYPISLYDGTWITGATAPVWDAPYSGNPTGVNLPVEYPTAACA